MWSLLRLAGGAFRILPAIAIVFGLVSGPQPARAVVTSEISLGVLSEIMVMFFYGCTDIHQVGKQACDPLSYTKTDGNVFESDTTSWDVLLPLQLTDGVTVGAILGGSESDFSLPTTATQIDTDTSFVGWFGIFTPTDKTRISVTNIYTWNEFDFTAAGSTGTRQSTSDSWKADVSHRFDQGRFSIVPTIGGFHANGEMNGFFDTFFGAFTPGVDVTLKRFYADLAIHVPLGLGRGYCSGAKGEICEEGGGGFKAHVTLAKDDIDGLVFDPTAGFGLPDTNYTGVIAGVGTMIPVHKHVSVGGTADWFDLGDMDGYSIKAIVNVDLFGLMGK